MERSPFMWHDEGPAVCRL